MERLYLEHIITLSSNIANLKHFIDPASDGDVAFVNRNGDKRFFTASEAVVAVFNQLKDTCERLDLIVASATIDARMQSGRISADQVEVLVEAVKAEMASRLFLRVPSDRAKFWERDPALPEQVRINFPAAVGELRSAGTAYACGLWNASVFHSMRAAEQGLLVISDKLSIARAEGDNWGNIIQKAEASLRAMAEAKNSPGKTEKVRSLSELLVDARLFKDAWRNHVSHSLVGYNDGQALEIMKSVARFLTAVSATISAP